MKIMKTSDFVRVLAEEKFSDEPDVKVRKSKIAETIKVVCGGNGKDTIMCNYRYYEQGGCERKDAIFVLRIMGVK